MRADFPVSGENVCEADKRGLEVDSPKAKTEGENKSFPFLSPSHAVRMTAPSSEGALSAPHPQICVILSVAKAAARRRRASEQPPKAALSES